MKSTDPSASDEGAPDSYASDITGRINKVRTALDAIRRLQSDATAGGQFDTLVEDMETYLRHLRASRDRAQE